MADSDPYVYPCTVYVLKNKPGIVDPVKLERYEAMAFIRRHAELTPDFPAGHFDYNHLKTIHQHLFQDLYEWAGQERTINIGKDDSWFAKTQFIGPYANRIFGEIKDQGYLRRLSCEGFAQLAAHYFSEINAIHPFREGNGRALRAFYSQLAAQAGYELHWERVTKELHDEAIRQAFFGQSQKLREHFRAITVRA